VPVADTVSVVVDDPSAARSAVEYAPVTRAVPA